MNFCDHVMVTWDDYGTRHYSELLLKSIDIKYDAICHPGNVVLRNNDIYTNTPMILT